jgi:putative ABC transport system substrate-binding protein
MRRRELITLLAGFTAWPITAGAQQVGKVHRVGLFFSTSPVSEMVGPDPTHPLARAFVHGLRDLGYVQGRNLVLEHRSAEGKFERFPEIIRELISANVDVIVTVTTPMSHAAKAVTQTVPIVMLSNNVLEEGLIQSLARPGGNITGLTAFTSLEIVGKQLQLFKELLPGMSVAASLQSRLEINVGWEQSAEAAGRQLGVRVLLAKHTPTNYADAFAFILRERVDALLVASSAANFANRHLIVDFAAKNRLPAMYGTRAYVDAGGLVAYGSDLTDLFRRLAGYVDRILKGAKPAELPVEYPTKIQLIINMKTAKALGLTMPSTLLARADEVIE